MHTALIGKTALSLSVLRVVVSSPCSRRRSALAEGVTKPDADAIDAQLMADPVLRERMNETFNKELGRDCNDVEFEAHVDGMGSVVVMEWEHNQREKKWKDKIGTVTCPYCDKEIVEILVTTRSTKESYLRFNTYSGDVGECDWSTNWGHEYPEHAQSKTYRDYRCPECYILMTNNEAQARNILWGDAVSEAPDFKEIKNLNVEDIFEAITNIKQFEDNKKLMINSSAGNKFTSCAVTCAGYVNGIKSFFVVK